MTEVLALEGSGPERVSLKRLCDLEMRFYVFVRREAAIAGYFARHGDCLPSLTTVEAAGLHGDKRAATVAGMRFVTETNILEIAKRESEDYLIIPRPDSVVGRPASESPGLAKDFDVCHASTVLESVKGRSPAAVPSSAPT